MDVGVCVHVCVGVLVGGTGVLVAVAVEVLVRVGVNVAVDVEGLVGVRVAVLVRDGVGVIVGVLVVGLLGGAFSAMSYGAALKLKSEDSFAPVVNGLMLPVLLLSGILLPMALAPGWLQTVADVNPLTHIVDGVRSMFRGEITSTESLLGVGLTIALLLLGMVYGSRVFRKESA